MNRPLHEQVPPEPAASPVHLQAVGQEIRWWRPGWRDALRYMGWRWVLLLPAAGVIVMLVVMAMEPGLFRLFWYIGPKFSIMLLSLPFLAAGYAFKRAIQARTEPFCIHCGYDLAGLPDHYQCPECGVPYTFNAIEEYRRDPAWFIQRYKAQGQFPVDQAPFEAGPRSARRRSRDGT